MRRLLLRSKGIVEVDVVSLHGGPPDWNEANRARRETLTAILLIPRERRGIFAEFGEGVKGAAPDDAALFERDEHGAKQGESEDNGAEGKEECIPGGDARVTA